MISKLVNTSGFAIILISLVLPFFSVKCNTITIAEFNGYHLLAGKEYTIKNGSGSLFGDKEDAIGTEEKGRLAPNGFMIAIVLVSLCGILVSLLKIKFKRRISALIASLGLLSLILMTTLLSNELENKGEIGNSLMGLEIRLVYNAGFWIMLVALIGLIIYNCILMVLDSKKAIPPSSPLNDYEPPPSIDKIE